MLAPYHASLRPTFNGFAFGGAFYTRQPGTGADWKPKYNNLFFCLSVFGQPKLLPISELKVDAGFRQPA